MHQARKGNEQESPHLLIVDDEPAVLDAVARTIDSWVAEHGVSTLKANSGSEALQLLEQYGDSVWLLLTDLRMPQMNGVELIDAATERYPRLVTLMQTVEDSMDELSRSVRAGIFGLIPKPWEPQTLREEVARAFSYAQAKRDGERYLRSLETELQWAGELQQRLLEVELPRRAELDINLEYRPVPWLSCGGDYYDVIPYHEDSVIVLIGDVAGHGVKAAFVTAMLKSLIYRGFIRESLKTGFSPAKFLTWLNARFLEEFSSVPDVVLTFSASLVNSKRKHMITSGAGHEPVFIHGSSGASVVRSHGPLIGVSGEARFSDETVSLERGDVLTFLTDGAVEYPRKGNHLSAEVVSRILARHVRSAKHFDAVLGELFEALDMPEQQDDVTVLQLELL